MKIIQLICNNNDFTINNILQSIKSIKKLENHRLLTLYGFLDLVMMKLDRPTRPYFTFEIRILIEPLLFQYMNGQSLAKV
jgi:hypothetical protein